MTIAEEINRACDEVEKFDEACRIASQQAEAVNELCTWIDELKAYRDTGVTPEEIAEVQAAIDPIPFERFHDILEAECGGCQRRCDFVVFRRTGYVEKWRVMVYSLCIIILAVFVRQA